MKLSFAIIASLTFGLGGLGAEARAAEGKTEVVASVPATCTVRNVSDLSFGKYNAVSSQWAVGTSNAVEAEAAFSIQCNNGSLGGSQVAISMGPGNNHNGAGCMTRRLGDGNGNFLNYELFSIPARSLNSKWGCQGTDRVLRSGMDTGLSQQVVVYGRILNNQGLAPAGSYTDVIDVMISF